MTDINKNFKNNTINVFNNTSSINNEGICKTNNGNNKNNKNKDIKNNNTNNIYKISNDDNSYIIKKIDIEKTNKLINTIKDLGIDGSRYIEENIDMQYSYLKDLHNKLSNKSKFLKLIIINGIASYQLSTTGENWWKEFSQHNWTDEEDNIIDEYITFLKNSKGNRRLLEGKIKRIKKLSFLNNLSINDLKEYYDNMENLRNDLAENLGSKKEGKTVVFAVKMFGYGSRMVFKYFNPYPFTIDIPLDSRINKFTERFLNSNKQSDKLRFWNFVSEKTGVPPLHIDSILWSALGKSKNVIDKLKSNEKYRKLLK